MSEKSYKTLAGNLDGWVLDRNAKGLTYPRKPVDVKTEPVDVTVEQVKEIQTKSEPTREEMVEYLKERGIKVHWNIGDEKLKQRYESEIEVS